MATRKIVIFNSNQDIEGLSIGFQVLSGEYAKNFKKALKFLAGHEIEGECGNETFTYSDDLFIFESVTDSDLKTLEKLFDIGFNDDSSEVVGLMPDVMSDYENNYIEDEESDDSSGDYEDED